MTESDSSFGEMIGDRYEDVDWNEMGDILGDTCIVAK